jgi:hypothetical protein
MMIFGATAKNPTDDKRQRMMIFGATANNPTEDKRQDSNWLILRKVPKQVPFEEK